MKDIFYNFKATSLQGKEIAMETFKGKTLVIVNTASKCGLTLQFEGLEELYQKYKDKGLVILGFPCNQFANQEPGDEKSIEEGCVINYGVTFPMFAKIDVNGTNTHPIFKYLKSSLGGFFGSRVKWNFTKFLIDSTGTPVKRFAPNVKPTDMESDIVRLLNGNQISEASKKYGQVSSTTSMTITRIVLGVFLLFTGIGHLTWSRSEFLAQVPSWLPLNGDLVVVLSGFVEIVLGLSLLFYNKKRVQVGLFTALFFVLIFPGNLSQYINGIDAFGLETDQARLIRLFFQPVLVWVALWSTGAKLFWQTYGFKAFFASKS